VRAWATTVDRRTGWGTPARITAPAGGDVVELAVTIGPDGGGHVAWREEVGKGVDLWGTRFRPGQGWGTPARLEALEGRVDSLDAVGDGRGGAALVWRHEGAKSREAFVVQADAAGGWSAPRRLDPGKPRDVRFAQVGGTRDGRLTACWVRVVARGEELVVADFAPGRGWGRPQVVYVSEIGKIRFPDLAINEHGDVLAAWRVVDDEDDTVRVWTTSFSPAGGWAKPSLLTARDAKDAGWPKVGLSRDGVGLLVWREEDGTVQSTFARRFDAGKGWGEVQVIENQRLDTRHPELAMAASGRAFVVWDQSDRTHKDLWTNEFHPGRGWGEATLVETERGAVQEGKVAIAGDFAMIVWAQANRGGQILPWAATLD
jgi:hypothetical protein